MRDPLSSHLFPTELNTISKGRARPSANVIDVAARSHQEAANRLNLEKWRYLYRLRLQHLSSRNIRKRILNAEFLRLLRLPSHVPRASDVWTTLSPVWPPNCDSQDSLEHSRITDRLPTLKLWVTLIRRNQLQYIYRQRINRTTYFTSTRLSTETSIRS